MAFEADELEALNGLQLDALRNLMPEAHRQVGVGAYVPFLKKAIKMAREHGFKYLGGGSSRFAVEAEEGVAKIAYKMPGLFHNLQEATAWLAYPSRITQHLTPCLLLAPTFVLIQERVDVLGPTLPHALGLKDADKQRRRAWKPYEHQILEARRALTRTADPDENNIVRPDNFGLRESGELVAIDYCEWWRPMGQAWSWVLRRSEKGPLILDETESDRLRARLLKSRDFRIFRGERPTGMTFIGRAGLRPTGSDPCPCSGYETYAKCFRRAPDKCWLSVDALDYSTLKALCKFPPPAQSAATRLFLERWG